MTTFPFRTSRRYDGTSSMEQLCSNWKPLINWLEDEEGDTRRLVNPEVTSGDHDDVKTTVTHDGRLLTSLAKTGIYYNVGEVIGGRYSFIYKGYYEPEKKHAAVKRVMGRYSETTKNEINVWSRIRNLSVNIVKLYHWVPFREGGEDNYYFAMELATSDLKQWLHENQKDKNPSWRSMALKYLQDATSGLKWLHLRRIVHRNIRPESILIFDHSGTHLAKLGHFGINKRSPTSAESERLCDLKWMSPEQYAACKSDEDISITKAADIFSLGMTGHYTLTMGLHHPFEYSKKYGYWSDLSILDKHISPSKIGNQEYMADHIFQWMMCHREDERPKISQVADHPLFWDTMTQFNFILEVTKTLHNEEDCILMEKLDRKYCEGNKNFNWQTKLPRPFLTDFLRKRSFLAKKTKTSIDSSIGTSVSHLLMLIREKYLQRKGIVDSLINDKYFGQRDSNGYWEFSEQKYGDFFVRNFPDLVIFLFVFLVIHKNTEPLKRIKGKVVGYTADIPDIPIY